LEVGILSESLEDYLETIYNLTQEKGEARVSEIAERRDVSMASVCQALQRLNKEELITYGAREMPTLTPKGNRLAQKIASRHRFVRKFLREILGVQGEAAERDACLLEHHLSRETLSHLVAFTQFAESARCDGETVQNAFRRCEQSGFVTAPDRNRRGKRRRRYKGQHEGPVLSALEPGDRARVVHLHAGCAVRQRLVDMGILPGVELTLVRKAPLGDPVEIRVRGFSLSLRREEAQAIEVEPIR
jgi:DtxR family Mn-dependent transcriptional regulator